VAAPAQSVAAEATRRELIARAIALAGTRGDAGALRAMIRAEQVLIVTYEQLLSGGALTDATGRLATEFLGHEQAHLAALRGELGRRALPRLPRGLGTVTALSARQGVRLLVEIERAALSVYYTELARITDAQLAGTAAAIMANEAQHAAVLLELLSPGNVTRAVPAAFVDGTR
jgi:rubrerythrin